MGPILWRRGCSRGGQWHGRALPCLDGLRRHPPESAGRSDHQPADCRVHFISNHQGRAVPVFADIDPQTLTLDPQAIEQSITERTRAIVPVHLYGQMAEMPAICEIAGRHNLIVIEDAAQAHGAGLNGKRAGAHGQAAAFSFYPTKNLGAYGDGGAVVSNDPRLIDRVKRLRDR